jgi:hypothetical protein
MPAKKASDIYSDFLKSYRPQEDSVTDQIRNTIHDRLVETKRLNSRKKRDTVVIRGILAIAAVLILVFTFSFNFDSSDKIIERNLIHTSSVPLGKPVTVTLSYNSTDDFEEVQFFVKLDEEIFFHTENDTIKGLKEHRWQGSLKKGVNQIPFVVKTTGEGKRKITVEATYGSFVHKQEIFLESDQDEIIVTHYAYDPVPII